MKKQPEALRLAEDLEMNEKYCPEEVFYRAAAELRRLHNEVKTLRDSCEAKADRIDRLGEMVERLTKTLQTILNMSLMNNGYWAKTIEVEAHSALQGERND